MNMFEMSYDVFNATPERSENVLRELMSVLVHRLGCPTVKKFVASSLVFATAHNYFEVVSVMNEWSNANKTYFVIAQIVPHEDGRRYYYTMLANQNLQQEIDDLYLKVRKGDL